MRKFEIVTKYLNQGIIIPTRATNGSAGYDIATIADTTIEQGEIVRVPTGLKVLLPKDEYLMICLRSSTPVKFGVVLPNGVGIIDSDYYDNPTTDGEFSIQLLNITNKQVFIPKGTKIAQGIFCKYLLTDDDHGNNKKRVSGFGSTDKN